MDYLITKAIHIISVVTWFAGIFYLPRLFVYHAMIHPQEEPLADQRFALMERKLYRGIMLPSAVVATLSGLWLAWDVYGFKPLWLHIKIALVLALWIYQWFCARYRRDFALGKNQHSHLYYRWFNEIPVLILIGAVFLVILKPF